jgi:hypothetical protein
MNSIAFDTMKSKLAAESPDSDGSLNLCWKCSVEPLVPFEGGIRSGSVRLVLFCYVGN